MSDETLSSIRYSDDVEVKQPDEERLIEETIAAFDRVRACVREAPSCRPRRARQKSRRP